jgi:hypothetical protein
MSYLIGVFLQKVMAVAEGWLHYYVRPCNICFLHYDYCRFFGGVFIGND